MMRKILLALLSPLVTLFIATAALAETRVHGADSLFVTPSFKLAWAVLKGRSEADTAVVIRVLNLSNEFRSLRVEALDPFTKDKAVVEPGRRLERIVDVTVPRAKFADHPSAELLFFRAEAPTATADLVVYYLGVPDTTPEFPAAEAMNAYLDRMLGVSR